MEIQNPQENASHIKQPQMMELPKFKGKNFKKIEKTLRWKASINGSMKELTLDSKGIDDISTKEKPREPLEAGPTRYQTPGIEKHQKACHGRTQTVGSRESETDWVTFQLGGKLQP